MSAQAATVRALASAPADRRRRTRPIEVITHDRADEAHRLRVAGQDWAAIAAATGYANAKTAAMAVTAYLQKTGLAQAPEQRRAALQTELDRIDALQHAYWDTALEGDYKAAVVVLKILALRIKILGLDRPEVQVSPPRTLVVSGSPEEYVAQLKAIVEDDVDAQARFWPE